MPEQSANLKSEDIKAINQNMINVFMEAIKINKDDADLYTSLSVLYFINREYDGAVQFFKEALK